MNKCSAFIKKVRNLIKENKGFTLTELLVAVLIMLLATGALTGAMSLAVRHLFSSVQSSEAALLCSALQEFVEDELSFSAVKVETGGIVISKGTHNMGSDIKFYCNTADGSYVEIGEDTVDTYGKLVVTGDNYTGQYFKLAGDGSYDMADSRGFSLNAGMSLKWDSSNNWYQVEIKVVNRSDGKLLSNAKFTVKPLIIK